MWLWPSLGMRNRAVCFCLLCMLIGDVLSLAEGNDNDAKVRVRIITGVVQYEDLGHVPQANVELRDQGGSLLETQVTNEGGEFFWGHLVLAFIPFGRPSPLYPANQPF